MDASGTPVPGVMSSPGSRGSPRSRSRTGTPYGGVLAPIPMHMQGSALGEPLLRQQDGESHSHSARASPARHAHVRPQSALLHPSPAASSSVPAALGMDIPHAGARDSITPNLDDGYGAPSSSFTSRPHSLMHLPHDTLLLAASASRGSTPPLHSHIYPPFHRYATRAYSDEFDTAAAAGQFHAGGYPHLPEEDGVGGDGGGGSGDGGHGLMHSDSILLSHADHFLYSLTPQRWWVLGVFSFLSFMQCLIWVTFAPISSKTQEYYHIAESEVDLLLNWGPIIYLPLLPITVHVARSSHGLQKLVWVTAGSLVVACLLRLVPSFFPDSHMLQEHAPLFLHAAHIINAAAGPSVQATVTKLSTIWFGASERSTATGILFVSNALGGAAGFLLGPALVPNVGDMDHYLWLQFGGSALAFLATFPLLPRFFFPARPDMFPSRAAAMMEGVALGGAGGDGDGGGGFEEQQHHPEAGTVQQQGFTTATVPTGLWRSTIVACRNRSFVLLALSTGFKQGFTNMWFSVLSTVLPSYSDSTCGWLSFSATIAGVVAGVLAGPLTRHPRLRRNLKAMVLLCTALGVACAAVLVLLTPSMFRDTDADSDADPLLSVSSVWLGVCITLLGGFIGASSPLAFELSVELTYPLPEAVSGGVLSGVNNVASLLFLAIAPLVSRPWLTLTMTLGVAACTLLLLPVQERYHRMDHEADEHARTRGSVSECGMSRSASHRRRSMLAQQEDDMQQEFARVMREVDDGMQPQPLTP